MKIMITAANGQLGTDITEYFSKSHDVTAYKDIDLDITDSEKVMKAVEKTAPDVIINTAAMTNVDGCESNQELAYRVNGKGAGVIARSAHDFGARLVHISTDYVFNGRGTSPYTEDMETCPVSVYGKSKLEGEQLVSEYCPESFILRTAWLYGPHGHNFVKTMLKLGREKGAVGVVTDQVGNPTSTFELTRIVEAVLKAGQFGVYHATCEGICSWNEFAREIFKLAGLDVAVSDVTSSDIGRAASRPAYSALSKEKLFKNCGYRPKDWRSALREYFEYDGGRQVY